MFKLSREEQQQVRAPKLVQTLDELISDLGMDELVDPQHYSIFKTQLARPLGTGPSRTTPTVTARSKRTMTIRFSKKYRAHRPAYTELWPTPRMKSSVPLPFFAHS